MIRPTFIWPKTLTIYAFAMSCQLLFDISRNIYYCSVAGVFKLVSGATRGFLGGCGNCIVMEINREKYVSLQVYKYSSKFWGQFFFIENKYLNL